MAIKVSAMSAGFTNLLAGIFVPSHYEVKVAPGKIAVTLMWCWVNSFRNTWLRLSIADFVTQ